MLRKVIFDMDGLIFDSEREFMDCLEAAMADRGYTLTEEIYAGTIGLNAQLAKERMLGIYGADYPYSEISRAARDEMTRRAVNGLTVKKGIVRLLKRLNERGVVCVVASSTDTRFVREYLESAGLMTYFSHITGGDAVRASKPAPDIFLEALGTTRAEDAFVLEDSENGVIAAQRAGIRVICIPDMKRPSEEVLAGAFACAADADEAANIMEGLE